MAGFKMRLSYSLFYVILLWCFSGAILKPISLKANELSSFQNSLKISSNILMTQVLLLSQPAIAEDSKQSFYERFKYEKPTDILIYIESLNLKSGDATGVLNALKDFSQYYPMYMLSTEKIKILLKELQLAKPTNILEIGTFFGFSALNMVLNMPSNTKLTCIEANKENFDIANIILEKGLGQQKFNDGRVRILNGISTPVIESDTFISRISGVPFDFIFLDHDKDFYVKDLILLEKKGLLSPNCVVVADNIVFPGAPGYLEHVGVSANINVGGGGGREDLPQSQSTILSQDYISTIIDINEKKYKYNTVLIHTPFERIGFETKWKEVDDAMSVSKLIEQLKSE